MRGSLQLPILGGAAQKCTSFGTDHTIFFLFFFFFNFRHGQSKETTGKNVLKVVKLPSFKVICLKTNEELAPQSREILRLPDGGGRAQTCSPPASPPPPPPPHVQTSVNFRNFTEIYLLTVKTYHFHIWRFCRH